MERPRRTAPCPRRASRCSGYHWARRDGPVGAGWKRRKQPISAVHLPSAPAETGHCKAAGSGSRSHCEHPEATSRSSRKSGERTGARPAELRPRPRALRAGRPPLPGPCDLIEHLGAAVWVQTVASAAAAPAPLPGTSSRPPSLGCPRRCAGSTTSPGARRRVPTGDGEQDTPAQAYQSTSAFAPPSSTRGMNPGVPADLAGLCRRTSSATWAIPKSSGPCAPSMTLEGLRSDDAGGRVPCAVSRPVRGPGRTGHGRQWSGRRRPLCPPPLQGGAPMLGDDEMPGSRPGLDVQDARHARVLTGPERWSRRRRSRGVRGDLRVEMATWRPPSSVASPHHAHTPAPRRRSRYPPLRSRARSLPSG